MRSGTLRSRGITGVILASHWGGRESLELDWASLSAVKIDFQPVSPALRNVTNDQRAIIQLAMRRVVAAGYRRIGLVLPHYWDDCVDYAWSAGFLAEQSKLPTDYHIPLLFNSDEKAERTEANRFELPAPRKELEAWLERYRPEVLITHAPFVEAPLAAMGLTMPRDLAFVEIFLEECDGRLAGVRHNCGRVGEMAVEILANQLRQPSFGPPEFHTTTLVEGTWFDGASLPDRK